MEGNKIMKVYDKIYGMKQVTVLDDYEIEVHFKNGDTKRYTYYHYNKEDGTILLNDLQTLIDLRSDLS